MPILSLKEAKDALDIEHDFKDPLIQGYADAAQMWIERVTGKTFDPAPEDVKQVARMLIAHWYDVRPGVTDKAMHAVPLGIRALIANHRSFAHGDKANAAS